MYAWRLKSSDALSSKLRPLRKWTVIGANLATASANSTAAFDERHESTAQRRKLMNCVRLQSLKVAVAHWSHRNDTRRKRQQRGGTLARMPTVEHQADSAFGDARALGNAPTDGPVSAVRNGQPARSMTISPLARRVSVTGAASGSVSTKVLISSTRKEAVSLKS